MKYFILLLLTSTISFLLTPLIKQAAIRLRVLDYPDWRKINARLIPRLGGLLIFLAFNLVFFTVLQLGYFQLPEDSVKQIHFWRLCRAGTVLLVMGATDDFRGVSSGTKSLIFYLSGLYRGVWQYASGADLMKVAKAVVLPCAVVGYSSG